MMIIVMIIITIIITIIKIIIIYLAVCFQACLELGQFLMSSMEHNLALQQPQSLALPPPTTTNQLILTSTQSLTLCTSVPSLEHIQLFLARVMARANDYLGAEHLYRKLLSRGSLMSNPADQV